MGSPFKIEDNHHNPANNNNNNNNLQSVVRTNLPLHNTQPILENIHSSFLAMDNNNNYNNNRHQNNNLTSTFPFNDRNNPQKSGSQQNTITHSDSISNDNVNLGVSLPFGMASTEPSNEMDRKLDNIFNTSVDSLVPLSPPLSLSLHQDFEEDDELDFMSSTNSGNVSSGRDDDDMSDFGGDVNFRRYPPPSCFTANKILIGGWLLTGGDMASSTGSTGSEISDIHIPLQNSIQVRFLYGKHITKYEITQPAGSTLLIEYDFSLIVGLDFKTETKTIIIELNDTPTFKAKDGSKWINVLDFTQGNASHYRRHYIEFLGSTTAFTQQMAKLLAFDARLSSLADIGLVEPPENNFIGSPVLCDWDRENIAFISCAECGNQNYCTECDEVLHRHPEKRHHKRLQTQSLQPHLHSHSHSHLHSIPTATMATATTTSTTSASAIHHPKRKKKKGERCRCGTGASKGTLGDPCTGNRCPCYSEGRSCANCGCKGCKNPYKDNPTQPPQPQFPPQSVHIQHPLTIPNFSSIQGTTQNFSQLVSQASGSPPKDSPRLEANTNANTNTNIQNPHFAQHSLSIDPSSQQSMSRSSSPQSDTYHSPQNTSHLNPLSHTTAVNPPNNNVFSTHHPHPIYHAPRHSHLTEPKIQTLPLSILHPLAHMNYHPTHISAMYHPPSTTVANSHNNNNNNNNNNNRVDDPKKS